MPNDPHERLREHQDLYRLVVENLRDYAIFTLDLEGRVATWNRGAERVLGYPEAEALGRPSSFIYTPEDIEADAPSQEIHTARSQGQALDERWHVKKGGERFWGSGMVHRVQDEAGEVVGFVKIVRDRTEQRQAEEELRTLNQTLESRIAERTQRVRRMARQLNGTEQQERRRLAERLHDHLQQLLVAAKFKLSAARSLLSLREAHQAVKEAEGLLDESILESRAITVELSPPAIPPGGLESALHHLAHWVEQTHGLQVHVQAPPQAEPPSEDLRTFIHRATRELLLNVTKHAATQEAWVSLDHTDQLVRLTVEDRGAGFTPHALDDAPASSGYGLRSLRERCEMLGGEVLIDSAPGQGTRVTLSLSTNAV